MTEEQLRAIFNSALMAAFPGSNLPGMEPVIAINRHPEGKFAFIELRTPEMATAALQLTGQVTLHGRAMSCERPQDYVDPQKQLQAAQVWGGVRERGPAAGGAGCEPMIGVDVWRAPHWPMRKGGLSSGIESPGMMRYAHFAYSCSPSLRPALIADGPDGHGRMAAAGGHGTAGAAPHAGDVAHARALVPLPPLFGISYVPARILLPDLMRTILLSFGKVAFFYSLHAICNHSQPEKPSCKSPPCFI